MKNILNWCSYFIIGIAGVTAIFSTLAGLAALLIVIFVKSVFIITALKYCALLYFASMAILIVAYIAIVLYQAIKKAKQLVRR